MKLLIISITIATWIASGTSGNTVPEDVKNSTGANKDMYVINAMVYQVGILTNETDGDSNKNSTGDEEALILYHTNGSNIDLSSIPKPLLTNVTAQKFVGVAPSLEVAKPGDNETTLPWSTLDHLAPLPAVNSGILPGKTMRRRQVASDEDYDQSDENADNYEPFMKRLFKRSLSQNDETPVKITKGSAVIPEEASVQSLGIPSLLTLNNKLSEIPVPIPNTSVVHYSKINTLVHAP